MSLRALYSGLKRILARPKPTRVRHAQYVTQITPPSELPPWSPVALLQKDLEAKCGYPIYTSISRLASFKPQRHSGILSAGFDEERDEPLGTDSQWARVAEAQDFSESIARLEEAGVYACRKPLELLSSPQHLKRSLAEESTALQPPTWLVMHILCNQAQTYDDMLSALKLMYFHIPAAPSNIRTTLLILTAIRLAQLHMVAPFRRLVACFLQFSAQLTADDLNLLIRAIALLPACREASALSVGLVRLAAQHDYQLTERTFDALLEPARCTRYLVRTLEDVARRQSYTFTKHQLQCILQFMSGVRYTSRATHYYNRFQNVTASEAPDSDQLSSGRADEDAESHARATTSKRNAQGFLTRISRWARRNATKRKGQSRQRIPRFINASTVVSPKDDWATTLLVAAQSTAVSRQSFIRLWRRGPRLYYGQLTTYHYNVAIKGMLDRWAIPQARELWAEFRRRRFPFNQYSIGMGATLFTLHREPLRAFYFLEKISNVQRRRATPEDIDRADLVQVGRMQKSPVGTGRDAALHLVDRHVLDIHEDQGMNHVSIGDIDPEDMTTAGPSIYLDGRGDAALAAHKADGHHASAKADRHVCYTSRRNRRPNVSLNLNAVNCFMSALNRMGRPSAVFALWDYMEILWGLRPDAYSLNILLQTARWSVKYNGTLQGVMARFTQFREPDDPGIAPGRNPRLHARRRMMILLHPKKKYRPHSLWNGESAPRRALALTVRMLLSNWPHLRKVRSPIPAKSRGFLRNVLGSRTHDPPHEPVSPLIAFADDIPASETYLQIVPTDVTFRAILDLLESNELLSEVPLVMAWMRKLQIPPSGNTFATALMYWRAVPDPEKWGGRETSYKALYSYLFHWRKDRMPAKRAWGHTFKRLNVFSRFTRLGLTKARIHSANMALRNEPPSRYDVVSRPTPPHIR